MNRLVPQFDFGSTKPFQCTQNNKTLEYNKAKAVNTEPHLFGYVICLDLICITHARGLKMCWK